MTYGGRGDGRSIYAVEAERCQADFQGRHPAGFETAKITVYPDGRIEASAAFAEAGGTKPDSTNSWDEVLR